MVIMKQYYNTQEPDVSDHDMYIDHDLEPDGNEYEHRRTENIKRNAKAWEEITKVVRCNTVVYNCIEGTIHTG